MIGYLKTYKYDNGVRILPLDRVAKHFKMAPRRKVVRTSRCSTNDGLDKENHYLRSLNDYQTRVRRRESLRNGKNTIEYNLERKIELERKMKEGSSRLLAAARHPAQYLEAARTLFTSNKKMSAYMTELKHRSKFGSLTTSMPENKAILSISDLRFPLMWRGSDHFKNRGDYRRFAVFCIVRVGGEVQDTSLIYPIDREQTDISFPDVLIFNNIPAKFEMILEVYSYILQGDLSIASTPRRIGRTIHSSISRTVGRKFAASLRVNDADRAPQFELVAYANMTLDDTDINIRSHNLTLNSLLNKAHILPLFDHFCCRLAVRPHCIDKESFAGYAIINTKQCWIKLQRFQIEAWQSKKYYEGLKKPTHKIHVNKDTIIRRLNLSKNQLQIINHVNGNEKRDTMEFQLNEDAEKWLEQLAMCVNEHAIWKHAVTSFQHIPCSDTKGHARGCFNCSNDRTIELSTSRNVSRAT